ncbi:unnamed protein product, partial [Didymodactylos carnosus]
EIKRLFHRQDGSNRFIGGTEGATIEWMKCDDETENVAFRKRQCLNTQGDDSRIDDRVRQIWSKYLEANDFDKKELIRYFYNKALQDEDATYLIKAYTAETNYYKIINKYLTIEHEKNDDGNKFAQWHILAIMTFHPSLGQFSFVGETYRGMRITEEDLNEYSVGTRLMNKAFLSTSKDRQVAEAFADSCGVNDGRVTVICIYEICLTQAALDIETISEYQNEREVLIFPFRFFHVIDIRHNINVIEIKLKECIYNYYP